LEAAETVGAGDGIEEDEVLDLLSSLADKSLVITETTADGGVRYRMLEPVRQYAGERLRESGEADELHRKHAALVLELAEKTRAELRGPQQRTWLGWLETEHDNMRAALGWSLERNDELGLRLGCALWPFWTRHEHLSEGRRWLEVGLARSSTAPVSVRAAALVGAGWLAESQGDYERARVAYEESLELYRRLGDEEGTADSLGKLGSLKLSLGEDEQAKALLEESLVLLQTLEDNRGMLFGVLNDLGSLADRQGDTARAVALYEEALLLSREHGDAYGIAIALGNMGLTTLVYGDSERATALLEESLTLFREVEDTLDVAICLINLGLAVLIKGDHQRATELLHESLALARELGDRLSIAECLEAVAGVVGAQGNSKRAVRLWGTAQALRDDLGAPLPADQRTILEPYLTAARARLDKGAWEMAFAEGRAMPLEEAVEYALSTEESTPPASPAPEQASAGAQTPNLSRREEEVAALVARGLTNRQIASELSISEYTAATHVSKILKKLRLSSRSQLSAWVTERGLPPSD
jgi:DNA-binding CsgD family transcriptional regulator